MDFKLSEEAQAYNFLFRGGDEEHDLDCPVEMIKRVETGLKPVACIVLYGRNKFVKDLLTTSKVRTYYHRNRWGVKTVTVYKSPSSTLGQYWNQTDVLSRYTSMDMKPYGITKDLFNIPIKSMLQDLSNETLPYEVIGLLYGYPLTETISLLKYRDDCDHKNSMLTTDD